MARSSQVAKIGRECRAELSKMLSEVMLVAAESCEANCPVKTGHLVSNFVLTTGAPFNAIAGSPESVSYAEQQAGKAKIAAFDVGRDGKIFLRNNVDYLHFLPGFVTESLQAGVRVAPRGSKGRVRKLLKSMARVSFKQGA